jgi:hypothetical protein
MLLLIILVLVAALHKGTILGVEDQDIWTMVLCQQPVVSFQHLHLAHLS